MKTETKQQEFTFHRVGFIDPDGEEKSCWLLLIDTKEKLAEWHKDRAYQVAKMWFDIKGSDPNVAGHCRTTQASMFKDILQIAIINSGESRWSMPRCVNYLEQVATSTIFKLFHQDGEVYVSANGACRDTHLRNDGRLDEHIFETCTNTNTVFPSFSTKDVKIQNWPGAKHYYITVDGTVVTIKGKEKYSTRGYAEEVMAKYIKDNRFKDN